MRYQPQKYPYLFVAVLLVLSAAFLAVLLLRDPFYDARDFWVVLAVDCVPLLGTAGVLCCLALRSGAWAMIEDDGIHIFSKKKGELIFLLWADARACRPVGVYKTTGAMLIFRYDMTVRGKPLATYEGQPPLGAIADRYLLDKLMFRLARGKMTAEEFRDLPFLIVLPDEVKKYDFEKYRSMWRAAKNRSDKREEAGQSLPCVKGGGTAEP